MVMPFMSGEVIDISPLTQNLSRSSDILLVPLNSCDFVGSFMSAILPVQVQLPTMFFAMSVNSGAGVGAFIAGSGAFLGSGALVSAVAVVPSASAARIVIVVFIGESPSVGGTL